MAAAQLRINGLEELRKALLALPEDLTREGAVIVQATGDAAMQEIAAAYPVRAYGVSANRGNLRKGLRLAMRGDARSGVSALLRSTSRHAWLFEHGTKGKERFWKKGKRKGKSAGVMPAGNVFIPIAIRRRRIMETALIGLVRRAGFTVTA